MKQKIKNYPPIKWIKDGKLPNDLDLGDVLIHPAGLELTNLAWSLLSQIKDPQIKFSSANFDAAMTVAIPSLMRDEILKVDFDEYGILIIHNFIYYYHINMHDAEVNVALIMFYNEGMVMGTYVQQDGKSAYYLNPQLKVKKADKPIPDIDIIESILSRIRFTLIFIKYAKVEIKEVKPQEKVKIQDNKYFNDSDSTIRIYDSTWFTTLIRSEEFKVRGHFRLQPYKDHKELIWIADFKKHGYTRHAKINLEDNKNSINFTS